MTVVISGHEIDKNFGGLRALSKFSFSLSTGEILGLIGPNGSGKTTLFNLISGLLKADSGKIEYEGVDITRKSPWEIASFGIARTFQIVRPFRDLNLVDNVAPAVAYGRNPFSNMRMARDKALEILEFCGLGRKAWNLPGELPLEDLKRLEVARAMASNPKTLLLDEVFAGLNPTEISRAIELLFQIREVYGVSIIMIEHVMKAIMTACSRVIALSHGVKLADASPEEVANHPEVITSYLGAVYVEN